MSDIGGMEAGLVRGAGSVHRRARAGCTGSRQSRLTAMTARQPRD